MPVKQKLKPVEYKAYDIDLTALTNQVDEATKNDKYWPKDGLSGYEYGFGYAVTLDVYLEAENLEPPDLPLIVSPTSNSYGTFLAYSLCFIDVPKIPSFLDYQKNFFQGNYYAPKDNFVGLVEYSVYSLLKNRSISSTKDRLSAVMKWVREERKDLKLAGKIPKPLKKSLKWNDTYNSLITMSDLVFMSGYTSRSVSFRNVFEGQTSTMWKKDEHVLAYLIDELYRKKKIQISEGGKGHFIAATNFFSNYLKEKITPESLGYKNHSVRGRFSEKYKKMREIVANWIETSFEK